MAGFLAWIVDRVRWLLLAAIGVGALFVYWGWSDTTRIRDIEANGVEAVAAIEGATRSKRRRSGSESFALKLVWRDAKGAVRTHDGVTISNTFARQIIVNDKIVRDSVRIKYVPGADADSMPMPIVLDDANRQQSEDDFMIWMGAGIAGAGALGSGLMFLFGRRRRSPVQA